jgi:integrase/recombinase XerD
MLERYFVRPETVDRIRSSWLGELIERYVTWLTEHHYRPRVVIRRVPILVRFGDFVAALGATRWDELPRHVPVFVDTWVHERGSGKSDAARSKIAADARVPVEQMLRLIVADYVGTGRPKLVEPFLTQAPGFFTHLRQERGLRDESILKYAHELRQFERYLETIDLRDLAALSPVVLSSYFVERGALLGRNGLRSACGMLRVFVRYLHREQVLARDLSMAIESPQSYRLSTIPRSITWDQVREVLEAIDRRSPIGKRDFAILLLLVTYGLRAREVAALTLDDIDWRAERLRVPERKAGHSTAFPLSPLVGEALLAYVKDGRPDTADRHVFFRVLAPYRPVTHSAVSSRAGHYLRRAGVEAPRLGSHTLRHTCVQRLVDADFSLKTIGDYVGHRSASSTEIYSKVAIEALREVALGDGEEVL